MRKSDAIFFSIASLIIGGLIGALVAYNTYPQSVNRCWYTIDKNYPVWLI